MCNSSCIAFARAHLGSTDVAGAAVLEVGAFDVNGSVRSVIESLGPLRYVGVDIASGPGVDEICDVCELTARYGESAFDVVVSTELVEHVQDWRSAFDNMVRVLKPGGTILITTRSRGFPVHGYPWDFWRYETDDMSRVFADFDDVVVEADLEAPGVFVKARKPVGRIPAAPLNEISLYSVIARSRVRTVSRWAGFRFKLRFLPGRLLKRGLRPLQPMRNRLAIRTRGRRLMNRSDT